jgi:esterase
MKLHFRKFGSGQPLIILHGLFGQSDNWNSLAKQFGENGFEVYAVDQRNHGLSPHSNEWNYKVMSDDLFELISDNNLSAVNILGHSMGGKTAMQFTLDHPGMVNKMIVADIAPKYYPLHHQKVLEGLNAIDFNNVKTRKEAEEILTRFISDLGTKQFLLKNIYWKENGQLDWRFNLKVITEKIVNAGEPISFETSVDVPALFIRGEYSNYIMDEDVNLIVEMFPRSIFQTIKGSGHWIHAEKPAEFFKAVMEFLT